jgi:Fe-S cluster assembly iron-binding protein IscA
MLSFTDEAADALRLILDAGPFPGAGVRISPAQPGAVGVLVPLQIAVSSEFNHDDELVLAPLGIPVSIEPSVAPLFEDAVLDGEVSEEGSPRFVLHRTSVAGELW